MKIIYREKSSYGFNTASERYDLNDILKFGRENFSPGAVVAFALATSPEVKFISFHGEEIHDHDWPDFDTLHYNEEHPISDIAEFMDSMHLYRVWQWDMKLLYKNAEISIHGSNDTKIGLSYSLETPVNVLPLLSAVETATYEYHSFDTKLVGLLKNNYKLNQKTAMKALLKLSKHQDIYEEFTQGLTNEVFCFPENNGIKEQGYTAKELHENYPLSPIGAYNYLVYLREESEKALADLKAGLPRK